MEGHQAVFCDHCGQAMEEVDIRGLVPGSQYYTCVNEHCIMALRVLCEEAGRG